MKRIWAVVLVGLVLVAGIEAYLLWQKQMELDGFEADSVDLFTSCTDRALRNLRLFDDTMAAWELLYTAKMILYDLTADYPQQSKIRTRFSRIVDSVGGEVPSQSEIDRVIEILFQMKTQWQDELFKAELLSILDRVLPR